ncbi:MAG: cytochrome c oxidase assembly factor 1 family protein [Defluviitaleaceae bacterium]|nr:cytochrome c oxidase assembly factor 1 family protein [Defluviitaleaceae bacterium]
MNSKDVKKLVVALIGAVVAMTTFILIVFAVVFVGITNRIQSSPPYLLAIEYIEASPQIAEIVGEIESFGRFLNGGVTTHGNGGRGNAEFTIRVNGTDGRARVFVQLEREPLLDWEIIAFRYQVIN